MPSESRIVKWAVELHWNKRDFICRRTKEFQLRGQGEEARSLGIKASHKLENHSIFAQNIRSVSVFHQEHVNVNIKVKMYVCIQKLVYS